MAEETRKVEAEVTIDADAETVWKAIADGEELKRWFPLDARVTPGEGGKVWQSFGEGMEWESPIEVWEPGRHMRTVDIIPTSEGEPPVRMAVDYYIESRGGETVVRLVHSGFGVDHWQDELDNLDAGWASFLANLKHYIEKHHGEPRTMAHFRHPVVEIARQEAFVRVLHALGFPAEQRLAVGDRYAVTAESGDRLEGTVKVFKPPINLTASIDNMSDAWMMVEIEPGREKCRPAIWISLYGDAQKDAPALQERIQSLLQRALAP